MVMIKRGKRGAKGAKPRRRAVRRSKYEVREQASLTEVLPTTVDIVTNQDYSSYNLSLLNLPRAQDVAKGYQLYRIKRVTFVIKPLMDTFTVNAGGTGSEPSVPYLYYMIDRTRQFQAGFSVEQLKAMGAKPRRLDDKSVLFSYTPSVLTETFDNTAGANKAVQYKLSPWLPTKDIDVAGIWNPNTTDHQGIVWYVEQLLGTAIRYSIERRVQVEFKKPSIPTTAPTLGAPQDIDNLA